MRQKNVIALGLLASVLLTCATLAVPFKVKNVSDLKEAHFGYPVPFVHQNLERYSPPEGLLPLYFGLDSPWGSPIRFSLTNFAFSTVSNFGVLIAVWLLARRIYRRTDSQS